VRIVGEAQLSPLHVVVPVRTIAGGKERLGGALDAEERETLILGMLALELRVLRAWAIPQAVHVVSPDPGVLRLAVRYGAQPLLQTTTGLNEGIREARDVAAAEGAGAVLVLPADLPLLDVASLDHLLGATDAAIAAGHGGAIVALAPADARNGTNALLCSPPATIEPCFGPHSLEAHLRIAAAADASVQLVVDAALGFDLDTPEDLEQLGAARLQTILELGAEALRAVPVDA
jgi:2-phospho-L-lactate/phosphoenolpyruvate guanylyltransferase